MEEVGGRLGYPTQGRPRGRMSNSPTVFIWFHESSDTRVLLEKKID